MRGVVGLFLVACLATGFSIALLTSPPKDLRRFAPRAGFDQPLANAQYRYARRLSEDGTVPENAWMKAKAALDAIKGRTQLRAGVGPASWTFLGPTNVGGRIRAILVHPTNPATIYIGSTSGGVWKTTDGGATWTPLDDFLPGIAISSMAIDPSNPNVLYAGTGEGFFETEEGTTNTACIRGAGVFKSTDAGATWNQLPSTVGPDFYFVNRLSMSPSNPSVMLAACSTGVWRTTNGGNTWTKTLAGEWAYDVDFNPADPNKAVAGVHDNGVFYSTNGGVSWTRSTSITAHRAEVAYAASNPSIVYATVSNNEQIRVWRSVDGGVTFALRAGGAIGTYQAYNNALWVNPTNPDNIIYGGVSLYRSSDGGTSRSQVFTNVHSDMHGFTNHPLYDGTTNRVVFVGTDGGIYRIGDTSGTNTNVTFLNGLGITQYYSAVMNPVSGRVMGGTQDNGTRLFTGNIAGWTQSMGGDGGFTTTDPANSSYFYGTIYWARHFRSTNGGTSASEIWNTANPIGDANNTQRVNFENFLLLDPNNPSRMLVCCRQLWRTNDVKATSPAWFAIKPDVAPPSRPSKGIPNNHMESYNPYNLSTAAVAQGNSDIIWAGHNNGQLYKTGNGTATSPTWTRIDPLATLPQRWVSRICIDPANPNHVYVSYMGWHDDSVWETTDGGLNWTDIASGRLIPASVNCLAIHPSKPGWLYAGTDLGLFTSSDNGASWTPTSDGPGTVPIEEITWRGNTIVLATYGRGVYSATINPLFDEFVPFEFSIGVGVNGFGKLSDVMLSENRRIGAEPFYAVDRTRQPVEIEFQATSPVASPASLALTVESSASAGGASKVSLYDHVAGAWVAADTRAVTATDATYTVNAPAPVGRFVGAAGLVKVKVGFEHPTGPRNWSAGIDRLSGRVGL